MAHTAQCTFLSRDGFLLSLNTGLFVVFSLSQFGQNSRFFTKLFKTPDGTFDRLIFSNSNTGHGLNHPRSLTTYGTAILSQLRVKSSNSSDDGAAVLNSGRLHPALDTANEYHEQRQAVGPISANMIGFSSFIQAPEKLREITHDSLNTGRRESFHLS
jgi:hypothetical protein